ncbi:NAD(P)-dependent oxidoreductase [Xanthobacter versatilis]|uniref:NAD(P)-dependent oxidoreductase n=1 Tax=Xanthobacter autotrophicus (strain ATCC BAA-1158 / Py2) TaxID=78245 RepID=UPI00372C434E
MRLGGNVTGVDNIDVAEAKARGIIVTNTPGANAQAVAEYVVTVAFALARKVTLADRSVRSGTWGQPVGTFEIGGKTIGIVGFGDIGARVAHMFSAGLDARVMAYDPYAPEAAFAVAGAVRVDALQSLLRNADVVSLHVPLNAATRGMIGAAEFGRMRVGSILINLARGGIVDEAALVDALASGHLAGAASDVFVEEPVPASHSLFGLETFIASPHPVGSNREALLRMGLQATESIIDLLAGRAPRNALRVSKLPS